MNNTENKEGKKDFKLLFTIVSISLLVMLVILMAWEKPNQTWLTCISSEECTKSNEISSIKDLREFPVAEKPVINLYNYKDNSMYYTNSGVKNNLDISADTETKNIIANIKLRLQDGYLTSTYPKYNEINGWNVEIPSITDKDAATTIFSLDDKKEYNYLYWEGISDINYNPNEGFVIAGDDTAAFLEDALEAIGLNRREANEFIVYWLPKMESNKYNYITFLTEEYTTKAELMIEPKPDNLLRVYMMFKGLSSEDEMEPLAQNLEELKGNFKREGFTVVEWGGTEILSDKIK